MTHNDSLVSEETYKENLVLNLQEYLELAVLSQPVKAPDWEDVSNG